MLTFFILLFPVSLVIYEAEQKRAKDFIPVIIGFVSAVLVCAFKVFFLFSHRIVPYSFFQNFTYILMRQIVIPVFVLYGLFFLISKENVKERILYFYPLIVSFFSVYLPYSVLSTYDSKVYEGFDIFVKPMIYLSLFIECAIFINYIYENVVNKKIIQTSVFILLLVITLCMPAVLESLYLMQSQGYVVVVAGSIFYVIQSFVLLCLQFIKHK